MRTVLFILLCIIFLHVLNQDKNQVSPKPLPRAKPKIDTNHIKQLHKKKGIRIIEKDSILFVQYTNSTSL